MENIEETKKIIGEAKNIYLIPSQEPEGIVSALALFYTLKELNKNVNLIIEAIPENLKFLAPSLDFISYPKNFVISIPNKIAEISQIYYEKNDNDLKIHLTVEKGSSIKKDNISFYFSESKPDLIITLGIKNYKTHLSDKLNSFGFLLDSPVLNIDNEQNNENFGKINLLSNHSLTEAVFNLIKNIHPVKSASQSEAVSRGAGQFNGVNNNSIKKEAAECLLSGLVLYTDNFKNSKITADIFETAGYLMKQGADLKIITDSMGK